MFDDDRRLELLAAIGIDVYRLRPSAAAPRRGAVRDGAAAPMPAAASAAPSVAICCDEAARTEAWRAPRFAQLVRALGVDPAAVAWVDASTDGALPDVPCYLMIGAAAARACSAQLSLEQQRVATIAVSADADRLFGDAPSRRALWQVLKPLARRLRSS